MSDPQDYFHPPVITEGYAVDIYPVRWKPYKPGAQTKKKGRWQRMNEYTGWDNCERPVKIFPDFPMHIIEDDAPDLTAEVEKLRTEKAELLEALESLLPEERSGLSDEGQPYNRTLLHSIKAIEAGYAAIAKARGE